MPEPTVSSTNAATPSSAPAKVDPKAPPVQDLATPNASKPGAQATPEVRKYKVKIDGREEERTDKELIDAYQLRQLSDKKRAEAEKSMSEYNKLFTLLKQDPIKFLNATGLDFDRLSTSYLTKKAEQAMRDPKDVELEKYKTEAAQYKQWVEEQKASQAKVLIDQEIAQVKNQLHQEIIQAIEEQKELGMPITEDLVIQIAQQMMLQDLKQKPLSAKEALPKVYQKTQAWVTSMAQKMDGEKLVAWLGQDAANKIRKYDLAQLKAKRAPTNPISTSAASVKPQASTKPAPKYKTWSQFKSEKLDKIV